MVLLWSASVQPLTQDRGRFAAQPTAMPTPALTQRLAAVRRPRISRSALSWFD